MAWSKTEPAAWAAPWAPSTQMSLGVGNTGAPLSSADTVRATSWGPSPGPSNAGLGAASAGAAAAAAAISAVSEAANRKAALDAQQAMMEINRETSMDLAKTRLSAQREMSNKQVTADAYTNMLRAMSQRQNTALDSGQLQRGSNKSIEQMYAQALLRGR